MGFEIKNTAATETSVLHLSDADGNLLWAEVDGEKRPVEVEVYGPGSHGYVQAQARRQGRTMQRARKKNGKIEMSGDETVEENARFLTDLTVGFRNLDYDGVPVTTPELIKRVYSDITIGFLGDQVGDHVGNWQNFTKGSATS